MQAADGGQRPPAPRQRNDKRCRVGVPVPAQNCGHGHVPDTFQRLSNRWFRLILFLPLQGSSDCGSDDDLAGAASQRKQTLVGVCNRSMPLQTSMAHI